MCLGIMCNDMFHGQCYGSPVPPQQQKHPLSGNCSGVKLNQLCLEMVVIDESSCLLLVPYFLAVFCSLL